MNLSGGDKIVNIFVSNIDAIAKSKYHPKIVKLKPLAKDCHISYATFLRMYENVYNAKVENLLKVSNYTGYSMDDLIKRKIQVDQISENSKSE